MASGTLGAKELPREKHKWSENSKVYTRKNHRNPKNNNNSTNSSSVTTTPASTSQSNDKNRVESNGGEKSHVVNGTTSNNVIVEEEEVPKDEDSVKEVPSTSDATVEKNHENIVEEVVPNDEDRGKEAATMTDNDVEINENGNGNIEEVVPNNEDSGKEVATTTDNNVENNENGNGSIDEEVPGNEDSGKEVASTTDNNAENNENGNGNIDEEVPNNEDSGKEFTTTTDNNVENNENGNVNIDEEVPDVVNSVEEALVNEVSNKDVPGSGISTSEVSGDVNITENNNEEVRNGENAAEEAPHHEDNMEEEPPPHNEENVEDVPDNNIDILEEEVVPQRSSSPPKPVEEPNLSQPEQVPSRMEIETVTLSEDSLNHDQVEPVLPNGHDHDGTLVNGVVREERPMVTQVEDRLSISVTAAKSKEEVRDLKRKLEDELDQVRKMARRVEVKETQLSESLVVGRMHSAPLVGRLHIPINGGIDHGVSSMRASHDVSYNHNPRPFGHLSVAVMDNSHHGVGEIPLEKEKRTPKANPFYRNSDFLLGKEKLPPAENHKKAKSSGGGRKHGGGDLESGFGFDKSIYKKCTDLLQKLRNHKHGWVFNKPVDAKSLGLHDYFDIIKHPMDLGTVKTRLSNNWYKTPREFAEDVRLTFYNAMSYNPEGQDVHIMAKELLRIFEEKWPAIEADYDRKLRYEVFRDLGAGTPTSRTPTSRKSYAPAHNPIRMPLPPPPLLHAPPLYEEPRNLGRSQSMPVRPDPRPKSIPSVRTPAPKKPKAKDPHKRDMTFDEKQKLSTNLQSLPSEKLDAIVQIIKKRNSALSQHDDEIEVDIDSVDAETLWELDRFVTNYKKSLSKHKRKAELAMQARAAAAQAAPQTAPLAPSNVEAPREDRTGDGNVAAASPNAQQERHSGNASDSSSSSSSSSSSGSSSSDSDSDSSSDSESDEEH